ncbi:hypothetical protein [Pedobacter sp. L105]|uniref:hypothetical protein n=1 Tax=Pedobacter sp. L105 TaxID=1641871 RepID=UPI00131EA7F9|nr:hypothetical protein [Pedobacter sp. L105]
MHIFSRSSGNSNISKIIETKKKGLSLPAVPILQKIDQKQPIQLVKMPKVSPQILAKFIPRSLHPPMPAKQKQPLVMLPKMEKPPLMFPKQEEPLKTFPKMEKPPLMFPKQEERVEMLPEMEKKTEAIPEVIQVPQVMEPQDTTAILKNQKDSLWSKFKRFLQDKSIETISDEVGHLINTAFEADASSNSGYEKDMEYTAAMENMLQEVDHQKLEGEDAKRYIENWEKHNPSPSKPE